MRSSSYPSNWSQSKSVNRIALAQSDVFNVLMKILHNCSINSLTLNSVLSLFVSILTLVVMQTSTQIPDSARFSLKPENIARWKWDREIVMAACYLFCVCKWICLWFHIVAIGQSAETSIEFYLNHSHFTIDSSHRNDDL